MDLQEMIRRGRFIMSDAPQRLRVFDLVNGRRNIPDIAKLARRHVNAIRRDLNVLADTGLIELRLEGGEPLRKNGFPVYRKAPLARAVPLRYFSGPVAISSPATTPAHPAPSTAQARRRRPKPLPVPTEQEILGIANNGEDQVFEFKGQGTEARKIAREIAAMSNTRQGGIIFYGIDDDGNIEGSDISRQKLDQPLQNSVRNSISPAITIRLHSVQVIGSAIIVVVVPPWNRKDVHQFEVKILIRKGTNVFAAKPEEVRQLYSGRYVI
jgi:hypothetical protein